MNGEQKCVAWIVGFICTLLMVLTISVTWYNMELNTKIENAKTCEQAAILYGGIRQSANLAFCKMGSDFRVTK